MNIFNKRWCLRSWWIGGEWRCGIPSWYSTAWWVHWLLCHSYVVWVLCGTIQLFFLWLETKRPLFIIMNQRQHTKQVYLMRQIRYLTINFLEHAIHVLQVVVIQKPHRVIPVVFIKGHWGETPISEVWQQTDINTLIDA